MSVTVGQVVHYTSFGSPGGEYTSECQAAIVTQAAQLRHFRNPDPRYQGDAVHAECEQRWHDHG